MPFQNFFDYAHLIFSEDFNQFLAVVRVILEVFFCSAPIFIRLVNNLRFTGLVFHTEEVIIYGIPHRPACPVSGRTVACNRSRPRCRQAEDVAYGLFLLRRQFAAVRGTVKTFQASFLPITYFQLKQIYSGVPLSFMQEQNNLVLDLPFGHPFS